MQRALEMIGNTAPFDITHHPGHDGALWDDGLPVGVMLIGSVSTNLPSTAPPMRLSRPGTGKLCNDRTVQVLRWPQRQLYEPVGAVLAVEVAAGRNDGFELRRRGRQTGNDVANTAYLLVEVPTRARWTVGCSSCRPWCRS